MQNITKIKLLIILAKKDLDEIIEYIQCFSKQSLLPYPDQSTKNKEEHLN